MVDDVRQHSAFLTRRKGSYACDECRRRKKKCNRSGRILEEKAVLNSNVNGTAFDVPCLSCMTAGTRCTYGEHTRPKAGYPKAYIEDLEQRIEQMGEILRRLYSSVPSSTGLSQEFEDLLAVRTRQNETTANNSLKQNDLKKRKPEVTAKSPPGKNHVGDAGPVFCSFEAADLLSGEGFDGESSSLNFSFSSLRIHSESNPRDSVAGLSDFSLKETLISPKTVLEKSHATPRRVIETSRTVPSPPFPPQDLVLKLVDIYFSRVNIIWPLLHGPTFRADVMRLRHLKCNDYANVVLAVCAVASRYCDDRRVLAKVVKTAGSPESSSSKDTTAFWIDDRDSVSDNDAAEYADAPLSSAGWKYYIRIKQNKDSILAPVRLTELQTVFLVQQFLLGLPDVTAGWVAVGAAIRRAQDLGIHRRETHRTVDLKTELWKRAFWCLVVSDRLGSARFGRTCCLNIEDMDVDVPVEIDDEFWSRPDENGRIVSLGQPPGRPSYLAAFNAAINLSYIYTLVQKSLYVLDEGQEPILVPKHERTQQSVDYLNEILAEWFACIPPHLKRDSSQPSFVSRAQSTNLHITYHILRMQIYQSFLPNPGHSEQFSKFYSQTGQVQYMPDSCLRMQALTACAHASRSVACLLRDMLSADFQDEHGCLQLTDIPTLLIGAFIPAFVLLTVETVGYHRGAARYEEEIGSRNRNDLVENNRAAFAYFMEVLRLTAERWPKAAKGLEVLRCALSIHTRRTGAQENAMQPFAYLEYCSPEPPQDFSLASHSEGKEGTFSGSRDRSIYSQPCVGELSSTIPSQSWQDPRLGAYATPSSIYVFQSPCETDTGPRPYFGLPLGNHQARLLCPSSNANNWSQVSQGGTSGQNITGSLAVTEENERMMGDYRNTLVPPLESHSVSNESVDNALEWGAPGTSANRTQMNGWGR